MRVGTSEGNRGHKFCVVTHVVDGGGESFIPICDSLDLLCAGGLDLLERAVAATLTLNYNEIKSFVGLFGSR